MDIGYTRLINWQFPEGAAEREIISVFRDINYPEFKASLNRQQGRGCAVDGYILNKDEQTHFKSLETKHDMKSKETGNLFIELEQTRDTWKTSEISGCALAEKNKTDFFLVVCYDNQNNKTPWLFWAPPKVWLTLTQGKPCAQTKPSANGNRPVCFAKGRLTKIWEIQRFFDTEIAATNLKNSSPTASHVPSQVHPMTICENTQLSLLTKL